MRCKCIPHSASCHIPLNGHPLTLPTSLRAMKDSMFEDLLTTMDSTLSQSARLLRSATALSRSLIRGQAPTKILRLEMDDSLLDPDTDYRRQDLDGLLEPCGVITPLEDSYRGTLPVRDDSSSVVVGTSLSPALSTRIPPVREVHSTDRSSMGSSTANVSDLLLSPAKRGLSTISSHLGSPSHSLFRSGSISASQQSPWSDFPSFRSPAPSFSGLLSPGKCGISAFPSALCSPARLPTPAAFNNAALFATDLRTPSLVSPVW